ncbi:MAG: helix-turn-helix transcriptional regulator [Pseudomonadota bacterium]
MSQTNPNRGSSLNDFLEEKGVRDEFEGIAIKKVLAWQIQQEMERQNLTRDAMAKRMKTSRAQLNRLLDPEGENVTLTTLQRAAEALGKSLRVELA